VSKDIMNQYEKFKDECAKEIAEQGTDKELAAATRAWMDRANAKKYSYHFEWLGRPIIQYPQDIVAMQEIIWRVQPDLIIETGIAHGGSLILSASILELIAACNGADGTVLGIDIDIRPHNLQAIEAHPLSKRITMIQGSSIDRGVISQVHAIAAKKSRVMVCLDSNHTHDHVLAELNAYAGLVAVGSYCIVFDTVIEDLPEGSFPNRPWGKGNNAKTAVWEWLGKHSEFQIDKSMENKLLATVAPDGFLRRIS
jgi:cephalosporin hydroxylase